VKTPNIDRLARRERCSPMPTARHPCVTFALEPVDGFAADDYRYLCTAARIRTVASLKDHVTLPQHFSARGYFTSTSGKVFHDGSIAPADRPREFQVWGTTTGTPLPPEKFVHTPEDIAAMDWGVFPVRDEDQGTGRSPTRPSPS